MRRTLQYRDINDNRGTWLTWRDNDPDPTLTVPQLREWLKGLRKKYPQQRFRIRTQTPVSYTRETFIE